MKKRLRKLMATVLAAALAGSAMIAVSAADTEFDLAVVNFDAVLETGAENQNLDKMLDYISQSEAEGDDMILFPEYTLTSDIEDAIDLDTNTSVEKIKTEADLNDMYVLFGSVIEEDEKVYSAMVVCDPDGEVSAYKKIHISDEQYEQGFSAGDEPYILATDFGNFGLALGNEFAETSELGKYYYGNSVRMVLVGQSYGYDTGSTFGLSQAQYDLFTASYAYNRMYGRAVAVANLYTSDADTTYFGESHICTAYEKGWIAGGTADMSSPEITTVAGIQSATVPASSYDATNAMDNKRTNLTADWYGDLLDVEMPIYGEGSQYEDEVKVASVNFHAVWGDLDANVAQIKDLMAQAYTDGVELLVFPEMALTAYSVVLPETYSEEDKAKYGDKYMQEVLAQTVRGENPSEIMVELQELAESYGMYVVIGLPEKDEIDPDVYWNSVAILGPDLMDTYRKVNLANPEPNWASYGTENQDGMFETSFGMVGVAICADIYNYQELQRTFAESGCRIVINATAGAANNTTVENGGWPLTYQSRLESFMLRDDNFMITSNLVGYEGPEITGDLATALADKGYTQDDITSSWLVPQNTDLYELLFSYNSETEKYDKLLDARSCVFPGASVSMALNPNSALGTTVYGNTSDSATIIPYADKVVNKYLDFDGDGKSPYLNYTTDTFSTYELADFNLADATLSNFYDENPFDYRPELYYEWYSEMFYRAVGISTSEKTLQDMNSVLTLTATMPDQTSMSLSVVPTTGIQLAGYELLNSNTVSLGLVTMITTDVLHTSSTNTANPDTTRPYTGSYAPTIGDVMLTIPLSENVDRAVLYMDGEVLAVSENQNVMTVSFPSYFDISSLELMTYMIEEEEEPSSSEAPTSSEESSEAPSSSETPSSSEAPTSSETPTSSEEPTSSETPSSSEAPTSSEESSATSSKESSVTTNDNEAPETGDSMMITFILVGFLAVSAFVLVIVRKRMIDTK